MLVAIFLSIYTCILMSQNIFAIELQTSENWVYRGRNNATFVATYGGKTETNMRARLDGSVAVQAGDFIYAEFTTYNSAVGFNSDSFNLDSVYFRTNITGVPFSAQYLGFSVDRQSESGAVIHTLSQATGSGSFNDIFFSGTFRFGSSDYADPRVKITVYRYDDAQLSELAQIKSLISGLSPATKQDVESAIADSQNKEKTEGQSATDSASQSASQSSTDVSQATQSLFSVFTGLVGAINNLDATEGSCVMTLPLPSFIGGSKNLDFCGESVPSLAVVSWLITLVFFVPLTISVYNNIIRLIRSFQ